MILETERLTLRPWLEEDEYSGQWSVISDQTDTEIIQGKGAAQGQNCVLQGCYAQKKRKTPFE